MHTQANKIQTLGTSTGILQSTDLILDMKILALQLQATAGQLDFHEGRLSKR